MIRNPILPGFHPDPSILRVGEDYYIATSTFEWYPGVRLHHSRDLVTWTPIGGVLTGRELVDLTGTRDSGGVWAPCLSYVDGVFHVVFTNVVSYTNGFWDTPNYVVTATSIHGPWTAPVALHSRGFDPSLFHDDDGRSWLLSNRTDWRPGHAWADGIIAQEWSREKRTLVGSPIDIWRGTAAGMTEGPHVYRRGGWYYLLTAEGGTGWEHQSTVARSRDVLGPYEPDPCGPLVTSWPYPTLALQKAGHGSLVETQDGDWYLAHLAARPLAERGRCVLGRETALQRVTWTSDGWPRVRDGVPHETVPSTLPLAPAAPVDESFAGPQWSTLRRPPSEDWMSLTVRPGHLRLTGGMSPSAQLGTSLVARRVQHPRATFECTVEFDPTDRDQMAGVVAYYNTRNWHYLRLTGAGADVLSCDRGALSLSAVTIPVTGPARLGLTVDGADLCFAVNDIAFPGVWDASILSDEYATELSGGAASVWGFTGMFVGVWAQDLTGGGAYADFSDPTYQTA